jgi:Cupredoxin-like domain
MGIAAKRLARVLGAAGVLGGAGLAPLCAEDVPISLTIKDHRFDPPELQVPAGVKLRLLVKNLDSTPEEFESHTLHREKVVAGGGVITVFIGPLEPGTYDFFGDFNPTTAQGRIIAK